MSGHIPSRMQLILGAVSTVDTTPSPAPVYRALKKIYPSSPTAGTSRCGTTATSTNVDELSQDIDHGICRCTQRACNDRSRVQRPATVGARLSPPRLNPRNLLNLHNRRRPPCQCTAAGESQWCSEQSGPRGTASAPRQKIDDHVQPYCNCGACTVFCSLNHGHMSLHTTGV